MENSNELIAHITSSAVIVYALEALKQWPAFRWLTADTKTLNRVISGVAAFAMAIGISGHWDPAHGGMIQIPALSVLLSGGYDWLKQMCLQQIVYDGVVAKPDTGVKG